MLEPVQINIEPPPRFERSGVALRVVVFVALCVLGAPVAWGFGALYLLLPVIAAVSTSSRGNRGYLEAEGARVLELIEWWTAFVGYLLFLSDRFPLQRGDYAALRVEAQLDGSSSVGTALWRLLTSLPVALVLVPLWWLAGPLEVVAAISVLVNERVPYVLERYFTYVTTLQARLLVYHASLVDEHPFFEGPRARAAH